MEKENLIEPAAGAAIGSFTRPRVKAVSHQNGVFLCREMPKLPLPHTKRAAFDEISGSNHQPKRRAALTDISNVVCAGNCIKACTFAVLEEKPPWRLNALSMKDASNDSAPKMRKGANLLQYKSISDKISEKVEHILHMGKSKLSAKQDIVDIDANQRYPQLCSIYASDIYSYLHVAEIDRRPNSTYMETVQQDITPPMRAILVDWLVEVCDEYKLIPDTLYLTVYLIDAFLSLESIARQRLQLLGITCLLIASKFEEICAPRVAELCLITDCTYTKAEVIEMESRVLNNLNFRVSAPTARTFLRRFIRAAQLSYDLTEDFNLKLELLAKYLTDLTLIHYGFLKFFPSAVAASAVFLARWTLRQSGHPWNATLEHYTKYKSSDLKVTVCALQCLQWNSASCPTNAIRTIYCQAKFKFVAALTSPVLVDALFQQ
ncbi:OLC1v1014690C1 [Oldenlandia corymbosa var. corymbosa]|uniref:OLC1v1014690C1 n=1 Tax=Oldenlandia corymbosa var. corymbosa TaxID=529605 RepID=A0AAV1E1W1_OLDCO|nr:OLC1v1014690C1 [Oldenlandia corymbosa var. corymbosa]